MPTLTASAAGEKVVITYVLPINAPGYKAPVIGLGYPGAQNFPSK